MAISLASLERSSAIKPPRILVHGVHGVGKTTFAAGAPDPVFIVTEDGLGVINHARHIRKDPLHLRDQGIGPWLDLLTECGIENAAHNREERNFKRPSF